jgi:hypothetical protein
MRTEEGNSGSFFPKRDISRFERGLDRQEVFSSVVILSEAKNLARVRAGPFDKSRNPAGSRHVTGLRVTDRCLVVQTVAALQQVAGLTFTLLPR